MTKRELVIEVATRLGFTQNEVSTIVQSTLDTIVDCLAEGHRLEVRNFGVFEAKTRDARTGRNPRTGEEVPIVQKRVVSFKPGKTLKEWVEAGDAPASFGLFDSAPQPVERSLQPQAAVPAASVSQAERLQELPGEQQTLF